MYGKKKYKVTNFDSNLKVYPIQFVYALFLYILEEQPDSKANTTFKLAQKDESATLHHHVDEIK